MSVNNQGQFFQWLNNEEENHQCEIHRDTDILEGCMEWKEGTSQGCWWLKDIKKELEQDEGQDKIDIRKDKMIRVMRKMPNWKAPGPDNVQGYWSKNLTPSHGKSGPFRRFSMHVW